MPGVSSINEEDPMAMVRYELLRDGAEVGGSEPDHAGEEKRAAFVALALYLDVSSH